MKDAIIATISYFDIFDYPLTSWEVWRLLYKRQAPFVSVVQILDEMTEEKKLETQNGFYFLPHRTKLVSRRLEHSRMSALKLKRAKRIGKLLAILPFVRMIGIMNSVSYGNATKNSDIDLVIFGQRNRLWSVRFFSVGFLKVLRLRPDDKVRANKMCLNMFVAENALGLEAFCKKPQDIHFAHIISHMMPIFDQGGYYEKYVEQNAWVKKYFPNIGPNKPAGRMRVHLGPVARFIKNIGEALQLPAAAPLTEGIMALMQHIMMPDVLKLHANKSTNVVLNNSLLKFHVNDRREEYNKKFFEKINNAATFVEH